MENETEYMLEEKTDPIGAAATQIEAYWAKTKDMDRNVLKTNQQEEKKRKIYAKLN